MIEINIVIKQYRFFIFALWLLPLLLRDNFYCYLSVDFYLNLGKPDQLQYLDIGSEFHANDPYAVFWSIKKYSLPVVFPCSDCFLGSEGTGI